MSEHPNLMSPAELRSAFPEKDYTIKNRDFRKLALSGCLHALRLPSSKLKPSYKYTSDYAEKVFDHFYRPDRGWTIMDQLVELASTEESRKVVLAAETNFKKQLDALAKPYSDGAQSFDVLTPNHITDLLRVGRASVSDWENNNYFPNSFREGNRLIIPVPDLTDRLLWFRPVGFGPDDSIHPE